jgi:hypothetical protein
LAYVGSSEERTFKLQFAMSALGHNRKSQSSRGGRLARGEARAAERVGGQCIETYSDWPGTRNPEPSHNLNSPVDKLLGYKVSVGRLSRFRVALAQYVFNQTNPRPAAVGRGLLRTECEEKRR